MNSKILVAGAVAITVLAGLGLVATQQDVYAYQGNYSAEGPNHTEEREDAMEKVMADKNYTAWKTLMTEDGRTPGVLRKIDTQAEFEKFAEAYQLGKAGKTTEANAIRAELGLGNGGGQGRGNGNGTGTCMN